MFEGFWVFMVAFKTGKLLETVKEPCSEGGLWHESQNDVIP